MGGQVGPSDKVGNEDELPLGSTERVLVPLPIVYIRSTSDSQHPWEVDAHFTDGKTEAE